MQRGTPYMTLVWQVPVAGGPLAIQPPDIQIVEAAIMQSLGLTPRELRLLECRGAEVLE